MRRVLVAFVLVASAACGLHARVECSDQIPCPEGKYCGPNGTCEAVVPYPWETDARPRSDAAATSDARDATGDAWIVADAARDAASDAGQDAAADAAVDAGKDAGRDAGRDASVDAGKDASVDAGRDAGGDASPGFCGDRTCARILGEDCKTCPWDCGPCECPHDPCHQGEPLSESCYEPCVATICSIEERCCSNRWDDGCVEYARFYCPDVCPSSSCGDRACRPPETCSTCQKDCGRCPRGCGNGRCGIFESCKTCPDDCGFCEPVCGDNTCADDESCETCPDDCGPCEPICGDGLCDEFEGCETCPEDCGNCADQCGDGFCAEDELCFSCPNDCGSCLGTCGDGECMRQQLEFCFTCPQDCGECRP
ncbi:MAG: hypothetical protein HY698_13190 [Deltaproteobacteria bacterium]|nr:hypothetical protein [Deltaproteobacteria bacterium]